MGNIIGYPQRSELPELELGDRKMHILCSVLSLASCGLASTEQEAELAFYFCSRDLRVLGEGMGGFDLGELPWGDDLDRDRFFLQFTCTVARKRLGWEKLGYHPEEEWLMAAMEFLRRMVGMFISQHIGPTDPTFSSMRPAQLERCVNHGIFRHREGCLLCP